MEEEEEEEEEDDVVEEHYSTELQESEQKVGGSITTIYHSQFNQRYCQPSRNGLTDWSIVISYLC